MAWGWGGGGLDFNTVQHPATVDDQVHLGTSTRLPVIEPGLLTQLSAGFHPFAHYCGLRQGAEARSLEHRLWGVEAEEKGRQAWIEQIQLGALTNPFAEVAVIRRQQRRSEERRVGKEGKRG